MSWIDLKLRKPTEADASQKGEVFLVNEAGEVNIGFWHYQHRRVAWMPIPEFTPIPDPPKGYEILQDYDSELHPLAMQLDSLSSRWRNHWTKLRYIKSEIYAVPIKPPEPQYRPFANADEFRPYRERWYRRKGDDGTLYASREYCDGDHMGWQWGYRFENYEFEDGTPFGIKIN